MCCYTGKLLWAREYTRATFKPFRNVFRISKAKIKGIAICLNIIRLFINYEHVLNLTYTINLVLKYESECSFIQFKIVSIITYSNIAFHIGL